ncbi:MAG: hypothetical protein JWQ77_3851 [Jatrophihabitans sp.]|nr:hypothetical protein [Jatrophihabitans sp.]
MHVSLRWPDGSRRQIYSPSLVVADHFAGGASYPPDEPVGRLRVCTLTA